MKKYLFTITLLIYTLTTFSQGVGINSNGSMPAKGAMLDVSSTTSGLLIPRMTQAQRDLIEAGSPPQSLLIYQTDQDSGFYYHDGNSWVQFLTSNNTVGGSVPVATVISHMGSSVPLGYLECDGSAVSRTIFSNLFAEINVMYGSGDGSTTFNLPDLRGYFLRGYDNTAGNDPDAASRTDRGDGTTGDNIGTVQQDVIQEHDHVRRGSHVPLGVNGGSPNVYDTGNSSIAFNSVSEGIVDAQFGSSVVRVSTETRPKNVNVRYCIKY